MSQASKTAYVRVGPHATNTDGIGTGRGQRRHHELTSNHASLI
jgi:hypothetical protein